MTGKDIAYLYYSLLQSSIICIFSFFMYNIWMKTTPMKGVQMENRTQVLWTEKAEFPDGWDIKKHSHDYYHLFYIISGNGDFIINKKKYSASNGTCFIIPPHMEHELLKVSGETLVSYEIKFVINDNRLIKNLHIESPLFPRNTFLEIIIPEIVSVGRSANDYHKDNTDALLCSLLIYISENGNHESAPNSELIDVTGFHKVTVEAINYIEKYYMKHIYLDDIAKHVDYNRNYLCTLFKKNTGITLNDYLNYVRIRKACEYISYSDIDINQIYTRVGFTNASHFNRTFKKFVGLPPGTFSKLYPVDIDGNLSNNKKGTSGIENQILTIADALGTLCHKR